MGKRTEHAPGTFSWIELSTSDPEAAKGFYGELFGWEVDDLPVGDRAAVYSMREGRRRPRSPRSQSSSPGAPRRRTGSTTSRVASADEAAGASEGAPADGAWLDAFDVLDSGRMAVLQDPAGAVALRLGAEVPHRGRGVNDPAR